MERFVETIATWITNPLSTSLLFAGNIIASLDRAFYELVIGCHSGQFRLRRYYPYDTARPPPQH